MHFPVTKKRLEENPEVRGLSSQAGKTQPIAQAIQGIAQVDQCWRADD
jgi:hypothetical protein